MLLLMGFAPCIPHRASDGELAEMATIRKFRIVQTEASREVNREIIHYNLQMIIVIGFKVNNDRAQCVAEGKNVGCMHRR